MMKSNQDRQDSHARLVLRATELLGLLDPDQWLERYDAALASEDDALLEIFCREAAACVGEPCDEPCTELSAEGTESVRPGQHSGLGNSGRGAVEGFELLGGAVLWRRSMRVRCRHAPTSSCGLSRAWRSGSVDRESG